MNNTQVKEAVRSILPLFEKERCVVWVGSGLSICAGYKSWKDLLSGLCHKCGVLQLDDEDVEDCARFEDKAEDCKTADPIAYETFLAEHFGKPVVETRRAYTQLLNLPFIAYVTTNYDPLLETAAKDRDQGNSDAGGKRLIHRYPDLPMMGLGAPPGIDGTSPAPIYHIHGLALVENQPCGSHLVLSTTEYHRAYSLAVRGFLVMLFTYYPVLFLGCRVRESRIRDALRDAKTLQDEIAKSQGERLVPQKIALLSPKSRVITQEDDKKVPQPDQARQSEFDEEKRELKELGVKVVQYDTPSGRHPEVEQILDELIAEFCRKRSAVLNPTKSEDLPKL